MDCFSQCDYCKRKESQESTPAPEISFYCRAKDEENYLCEAQCERCAKADKFELPAPEITVEWLIKQMRDNWTTDPILTMTIAAKAIHSAIAEKMAELKAQKDQLGRWYSDRLNEKSSETELRNQLAAKEKQVVRLKSLIEIAFFKDRYSGEIEWWNNSWQEFKQQHNL